MLSSENQGTGFEHWKRNFVLMVLDSALFMTALSLSDVSVISVFIKRATGSTFLVGLLQMFRTAGFFITQILSVNVGSKPYKRKILLKWTTIGRSCLIFAVLTVFLINDIQLIVLSFFISLTLFPTFDGFSVVPWLEFVAKSIPPIKRGSFFGFCQFVGAIGSVASGFLVSIILSDPNLVFPINYGTLVLIELIIMLCGISFIILLKERPDEKSEDEKNLLKSLKEIIRIVKEDESVRMLAIIQLLICFYSMAFPFYSIYFLSRLEAEEGLVGFFLSVQVFGRLAFSFIWGHLCNRGRNKQIIQYAGLMFLASPLLAVIVGTLQLPRELVRYSIMLIFALLGASMGGIFLGFNNYIMDTAERKQRPLLLGFLNSLNVVTSILPLLGGVIIEYLPYEIVFLASAIPISFGLILTNNLKQKINDYSIG